MQLGRHFVILIAHLGNTASSGVKTQGDFWGHVSGGKNEPDVAGNMVLFAVGNLTVRILYELHMKVRFEVVKF
jgi:hypothetical protein